MPVLQFKGKTAVENYHHTVPHHRLEFDAKLSLLGKGEKPSLDGNLIIEGDNLLALKALLPTHAGKVKCIYIDPPYNTGNEGWVYNDNLTQPQFKEWIGRTVGKEGEDACRHDKWCCMMYPRLTLLRELLREDGAIFVSIDDNEVQNLRAIMDEVFGVERWIATLIWKRRQTPDSRNLNGVSMDHEYVVCYAKGDGFRFRGQDKDLSKYSNPDNDPRGPWMSDNLTGLASPEERPNLHYQIVHPKSGLKYEPHPSRGWIYGRERMENLIAEDRLLWPKNKNGRPRLKRFLSDMKTETTGFSTILDAPGNVEGTKELNALLGEKLFGFPKPTALIRLLIEQGTDSDSIVLDSFAGSGTTGQAVLEVNANDGGIRRFVLVQMPYDTNEHESERFNIAKKVTRVRAAKVIKDAQDSQDAAFTYASIGEPLFGEYRDFGKKLPDWETLARYIFYTETGRECDSRKFDHKSGYIDSMDAAGGTSYYLRYSADNEENERVSLHTLPDIVKKDKNKNIVIYAERVWLHGDELAKFEAEHGRTIRPMVIPFGLK